MAKVAFSDVIGILGITIGIVVVVLDKAGKLKGNWLLILLVIAAAMTLFVALGNSWVTDAPEKWRLWRGMIMFSLVAFIYSGVAIWIFPEKPQGPPRTTGQDGERVAKQEGIPTGEERPHLAMKLVMDSIRRGKIRFHFQVENIGKLVVANVRSRVKLNDSFHVITHPYMPTTLPPGGTLSISVTPVETLKVGKFDSVVVTLTHDVEITGGKKTFESTYRFMVPFDLSTPTTLYPENWSENEEPANERQIIATATLSQLDQAQGTIAMALNEKKQPAGQPNLVVFGVPGRQFRFDPTSRTVSFGITTVDGRPSTAILPLAQTANDYHIVTIEWDVNKGALLRIDGQEKNDMRNNKSGVPKRQ